LHARQPTDVAVVRARLEPGGTTGWHPSSRGRRSSSTSSPRAPRHCSATCPPCPSGAH